MLHQVSSSFSIIAELAERSPIIIQNSSNPSSRKNLDVRPYKVLLLTCVVNCTAGTPTPRLCSVVQWSVHWAPSRGLVLAGARRCALETYGKKKMWTPLLGLVKSIYYYDSPRDLALNWGKSLRENKRQKLTSCDIKFSRYTRRRSWSIIQGRTTKELLRIIMRAYLNRFVESKMSFSYFERLRFTHSAFSSYTVRATTEGKKGLFNI